VRAARPGQVRLPRPGSLRPRSLHEDRELDAAVAGAAGRRAVGVDRLVGAGAAGRDPPGVDAVLDEVATDRLGAPARQVAVVLDAAGAVGVAGDLDADARELREDQDRAVEHRPRARPYRVAVEVEVDPPDRADDRPDLGRDD